MGEVALRDVMKPSLPVWLERHLGSISGNHRRDLLPVKLNEAERVAINLLLQSYDSLLAASPNQKEAFKLVGRFLMATSNQNLGPAQVEAKQLAFMTALDDLPVWAIEHGIARWHREINNPFPSPADLRSVCKAVIAGIEGRRIVLNRLLAAAELPPHDPERAKTMLERLKTLLASFAKPRAIRSPDTPTSAS